MISRFKIWVSHLSWWVVILGALSLGQAPFSPPHLWSHYQKIAAGHPLTPLDYFDLFYHLVPWLILAAKAGLRLRKPKLKPAT